MATAPHILLVEDEKDVRDLMLLHLKRERMEVTATDNGDDALNLLKKNRYDLTVLDWMLPGISGLEICKKIAGRMPILMVTARSEASDIVLGLEMGADDYVTKPFEIPVFMARVRALLRRTGQTQAQTSEETQQFQLGDLFINAPKVEVRCGKNDIKLTVSEFKLLVALAKNVGKVLSREKLIDLVQGEGVAVIDRAIDTHVFGLRKKLGPCADIIETIRGIGYRVKAL